MKTAVADCGANATIRSGPARCEGCFGMCAREEPVHNDCAFRCIRADAMAEAVRRSGGPRCCVVVRRAHRPGPSPKQSLGSQRSRVCHQGSSWQCLSQRGACTPKQRALFRRCRVTDRDRCPDGLSIYCFAGCVTRNPRSRAFANGLLSHPIGSGAIAGNRLFAC